MNPDPQDFEQLRRLFAIKRHEQPPPGYFDRFSREVVSRIKAGEQGDRVHDGSWLQRIWAALETKPVFAGAFGASVCAVLISGLLSAEDSSVASGSANPVISQANNPYHPAPVLAANETVLPAEPSLMTTTTDAASLNSLFDFNPGHVNIQSVNWAVPGGGN
jgi:hypothetical protein